MIDTDYSGIRRGRCRRKGCRCYKFYRHDEEDVNCGRCQHPGAAHEEIEEEIVDVVCRGDGTDDCDCTKHTPSRRGECIGCGHSSERHGVKPADSPFGNGSNSKNLTKFEDVERLVNARVALLNQKGKSLADGEKNDRVKSMVRKKMSADLVKSKNKLNENSARIGFDHSSPSFGFGVGSSKGGGKTGSKAKEEDFEVISVTPVYKYKSGVRVKRVKYLPLTGIMDARRIRVNRDYTMNELKESARTTFLGMEADVDLETLLSFSSTRDELREGDQPDIVKNKNRCLYYCSVFDEWMAGNEEMEADADEIDFRASKKLCSPIITPALNIRPENIGTSRGVSTAHSPEFNAMAYASDFGRPMMSKHARDKVHFAHIFGENVGGCKFKAQQASGASAITDSRKRKRESDQYDLSDSFESDDEDDGDSVHLDHFAATFGVGIGLINQLREFYNDNEEAIQRWLDEVVKKKSDSGFLLLEKFYRFFAWDTPVHVDEEVSRAGILSIEIDRTPGTSLTMATQLMAELDRLDKLNNGLFKQRVRATFRGESGVGSGVDKEYRECLRTYVGAHILEGDFEHKVVKPSDASIKANEFIRGGQILGHLVRNGEPAAIGLSANLISAIVKNSTDSYLPTVSDVPSYEGQEILKKLVTFRVDSNQATVQDEYDSFTEDEQEVFEEMVQHQHQLLQHTAVSSDMINGSLLVRSDATIEDRNDLAQKLLVHEGIRIRECNTILFVKAFNSVTKFHEFFELCGEKNGINIAQPLIQKYFPSVRTIQVSRDQFRGFMEVTSEGTTAMQRIDDERHVEEIFTILMDRIDFEHVEGTKTASQLLRLLTGTSILKPLDRITWTVKSKVANIDDFRILTCPMTVEIGRPWTLSTNHERFVDFIIEHMEKGMWFGNV